MKNNSLDLWVKYFTSKKQEMTRFMSLLEVADKSYLFKDNGFPYDDPIWETLPAKGFLEKDFRNVLNFLKYDDVVTKEQAEISETRLVLALNSGIKFENWIDYFGDDLTLVMARSLAEGRYEVFGINYENIVKDALKAKVLSTGEWMGVALIRGRVLGNRYPTEDDEKKLEKMVAKNLSKVRIDKTFLKIRYGL